MVSWSASPNPDLDQYSIRTAPGPTYKAADESVVDDVPSNQTTFSTNAGLLAPGSTALFKVYVVLAPPTKKAATP